MTVKLKSITDTSWLVIGEVGDMNIGLLSKIRDEYILMIKGERKKFLDMVEVNSFFKEDVFVEVESLQDSEASTDYFINGYPVDFDNPNEVIIKGNDLPLFSKKVTSEIYYSAGYYCLKFPKNWMPGYCPKLSTLEAYQYTGPYKTEFEMRTHLKRIRKEKKH